MMTEIFPFNLAVDATEVAGAGLWSLAFYLGFSPFNERVIWQLNRWFNSVERAFYESKSEFDKTRQHREVINVALASLCSVVPFLILGGLCNYGVEISLGRSWAISFGIIACIGCGIYEMGRRAGQSE